MRKGSRVQVQGSTGKVTRAPYECRGQLLVEVLLDGADESQVFPVYIVAPMAR